MTKAKGSWKVAKTSLSSLTNSTDDKMSLQDVVNSKLSGMESNIFETFVQNDLQRKGFTLTEEEEKMVQEAIQRTLREDRDSGIYDESSDSEEYESGNEVF